MAINTQIQQIMETSRPDPLLSFKWVCPDSALPFGLPCHYLEAVELPFENVTSSGHYEGGSNSYYPGISDLNGFNMTFYEDQKGNALKWLLAWKNRIKNFDTGIYKLPYGSDGYKQKMNISLLDTKNNEVITVEVQGIWPEATSAWSLNYNDAGRLVLSQAFSIDHQVIKIA